MCFIVSVHNESGLNTSNHVIIEVKLDLVTFFFGQLVKVVKGTNQTESIQEQVSRLSFPHNFEKKKGKENHLQLTPQHPTTQSGPCS